MEPKSCCKCRSTTTSEPATIRNTTWCRQCFIEQINTKFFQGLKTAKEYCRPPPKRDQPASLVIHFKNDLNSWLTLQLMRNYLNTNQDRSTAKWKSPIDFATIEVVSIHLASAAPYFPTQDPLEPLSGDEAALKASVERLGFAFRILTLDELFDPPPSAGSPFVDLSDPNLPIKIIDPAPETALAPLANALRPLTQTARRSMVDSLINTRLLQFCKHTPRNKVLVKTVTSTQMAIDALVGVSLGNGWSLDQQIGPSSYIDDVLICRPLAQIVDAELAQYSKLMEFDHPYPVTQQAPTKKTDIPAVITEFVLKLEENYPMTSSVINQTVNKIGKNKPLAPSASPSTTPSAATNGKEGPAPRTCAICHLSADRNADQWKRSITLCSHGAGPAEDANGATVVQQLEHDAPRPTGLRDQLCYACLVTLNDHQYFAPSSRSSHDWVQLPGYYRPLPGAQPLPQQAADHVQAVLDQFLISD
ncbi:hypothetical protein PTTG_03758 [Puccinia triticina 1-1 BBBD Race 1]|uniref:Cytoplasmic tRNA 2-thiolation protein 2 n=1 Tax=Puccinia triticina (isolate 1-1 / race 1 (BBBD)) TaxID=630390 RepID=A0A180GH13_PUCT1|nr:hypothetical protein PTTG_03758 [Puccinia triticina 1-1 BBBD Race 1]